MDLLSAASVSDVFSGVLLGLLGAVPFLHTNSLLSFLSGVGGFPGNSSGPEQPGPSGAWGVAVGSGIPGVVDAPAVSPVLASVLAFTHLAFESLPAVFFGVPTEGQGVSALPAHALVRQGQGRTALDAVLQGLCGGMLGAALLAVPFWFFAPSLLSLVRPWTAWLLAAIVVVALVLDGLGLRHVLAFLAFGAMGALIFGLPLREPLFPLLSGLFGIPAVVLSDRCLGGAGGARAPVLWHLSAAGTFLGCVSVFLPALSPSFLSALALLIFSSEPVAVLVLSSAICSSRLVFDFLGNLVLHTARSAPVAIWQDARVAPADGLLLLAVSIAAFWSAWSAVRFFWPYWLSALRSLPFDALARGLLGLVVLAGWALDGPWGLFVLSWSASASMLAQRLGVPRKYALGSLMLPAMVHALMA